jgi:hypothetical protein
MRILLLLALVCACRSEPQPSSRPATGASPLPPPVPAGHQCLPAMICNDWVGCALVAADKVVSADKLAAGEPVKIGNECSGGKHCVAARALPAGVQCPPSEIPAVIDPPPYTCVYDGKSCSKK